MTCSVQDINGREYAKLSELKAGDIIQVDEGFEGCFIPWSQLKLVEIDGQLAAIHNAPECGACEGHGGPDCPHFLDGQIADDNDSLIGIYKVDAP